MSLYRYTGSKRSDQEFREVERQLGLPVSCCEEQSIFVPYLEIPTDRQLVVARIVNRVPYAPAMLLRVDVVAGQDIFCSRSSYYTFTPIAHESGEKRTAVADALNTSKRALVSDRRLSWTMTHALAEGDGVSVLIEWAGSPGPLVDVSFSCLIERGRV